jgi:polar amino acid transport system substrate-binding protein
VQHEFLDGLSHVQGDALRFCIHAESLTAAFDTSVAVALADRLLIEPRIQLVASAERTAPLDHRLPMNSTELFTVMMNDCDALMGFILASNQFSSWLSVTRAYYSTSHVLVSGTEQLGSLRDVPRDQPIGTRALSQADLQLINHLQSLPAADRWQRFPYPDNQLLLERVADGTVAAALVWEPALHAFTAGAPEAHGLFLIPADPLTPGDIAFSIALKTGDAQLQVLLDQAILSLIDDGIITDLLTDHALPGKPGSTKP